MKSKSLIYFPIHLVLLQSSPIAKIIKHSNNCLNPLLHKLNHPTIDPLILCHCNHHQSGKIVKHSLNLLPHLSFATAITIINSQEHKALFETLQDCANWVKKGIPSIYCFISCVIAFAIIINSEKRSWNWSLKCCWFRCSRFLGGQKIECPSTSQMLKLLAKWL